ncbi:hypothetical protein WJX73_004126 [Symbiochloris irregularis]|uniref:VPS37 C-terminal domain-containing protein n=1 Tax=Symbiochloris irregularis TaxID=706552 RepID=A0AAW1PAH6_9CHLO
MNPYPSIHSSGGSMGSMSLHSPERQQQVAELTSQMPACRALNRDQSLFEAPVRLQDGRTTNLRLVLPARFPQERPGLQVTHPIQHPWVNSAGRLSFASLDRWNPGHSRLASVVQEAYAALTGTPFTSPAVSPQRPQRPERTTSSPQHGTQPASVPREFREVQAMGSDELVTVLTDSASYQALCSAISSQYGNSKVHEQLQRGNQQLAQENLAQESVLAELRNQIAIIRSSEYAGVRETFDKNNGRQKAVLAKLQPHMLVEALAAQANKVEEQADELQESFRRGDISTEAFVEQYTALRKTYHQMDLKCQAAQQTLIPS